MQKLLRMQHTPGLRVQVDTLDSATSQPADQLTWGPEACGCLPGHDVCRDEAGALGSRSEIDRLLNRRVRLWRWARQARCRTSRRGVTAIDDDGGSFGIRIAG
jgi:hypothetical protein